MVSNPECPNGVIYNTDDTATLQKIKKGVTPYYINFNKKRTSRLADLDAVYFLQNYILKQPKSFSWLPCNRYLLRVGQCYGDDLIERKINFVDGVRQIFSMAPHDRLWTIIEVYPAYRWEVDVTIEVKPEVKEASDRELKAEQLQENKDAGKPQRETRGWTKRSRFSLTDSLKANGKLLYEINKKANSLSYALELDYKTKAKDLSLLQSTVNTINMVTKALSTGEGKSTSHKVMKAEMKFPKLTLKGGGELTQDDKKQSLYMKGQVSVGFDPLIGININFDLLQAFAAWYHIADAVDQARQELEKREQAVNNGDNGAYFGVQLDLIASGEISLALTYQSNSENDWEWDFYQGNELKLGLSLEANARVGIKFYMFKGVLELSGKAETKAIIALDKAKTKDNIDVVFYHDGLRIEVGASVEGGISTQDQKDDNEDRGGSQGKNIEINKKTSEKFETKATWIIYDKLEKNDSTYRFSLG